MRPTIKMYNDSVNAADNWRKNHDVAAHVAYERWNKIQSLKFNQPFLFIAGLMAGVLGTLLAAQVFVV